MIDPLSLLGGSIVLTFLFLLLGFVFQIYALWLNWKQSKVRDQMDELLSEVRKIRRKIE
jgi:hypothetical protein